MLTYEPAQREDIAPLYALNKQLIDEYEDVASIDYPSVLNWVSCSIARNIGSFVRVLWDGELAGFYCLMPSGEETELDSLFVLPNFRNRGIGTEILRKCQKEASSPLFLFVFRKNLAAIRLYRRMGFAIEKEVGKTRLIMKYQKQDC